MRITACVGAPSRYAEPDFSVKTQAFMSCALLGGNWNNAANCSSHCSNWNNSPLNLNANYSLRGCADTGENSNGCC